MIIETLFVGGLGWASWRTYKWFRKRRAIADEADARNEEWNNGHQERMRNLDEKFKKNRDNYLPPIEEIPVRGNTKTKKKKVVEEPVYTPTTTSNDSGFLSGVIAGAVIDSLVNSATSRHSSRDDDSSSSSSSRESSYESSSDSWGSSGGGSTSSWDSGSSDSESDFGGGD